MATSVEDPTKSASAVVEIVVGFGFLDSLHEDLDTDGFKELVIVINTPPVPRISNGLLAGYVARGTVTYSELERRGCASISREAFAADVDVFVDYHIPRDEFSVRVAFAAQEVWTGCVESTTTVPASGRSCAHGVPIRNAGNEIVAINFEFTGESEQDRFRCTQSGVIRIQP